MTVLLADFRASLSDTAPAPGLEPPLVALWWAANGQWDQAHKIVQDESDANAADGVAGVRIALTPLA